MHRRRIVVPIVVASLVLAPAAYAATTAWTFSEPNGSTRVTSNNGVVGTLQQQSSNGVVVSNGRLVFNGHGRVVVPEAVADLDPGSRPFSVSAQVSTTVVPNDAVGDFDLVRDGLSSHKRYYKIELFPNAANTKAFAFCQMRGFTSGVGYRGVILKWTGADLADGVAHTITCTKTASQVRLIVDGTVRVTRSVAIGSITNGAAFAMGAKAEVWQDQLTGTLDNVVIDVD